MDTTETLAKRVDLLRAITSGTTDRSTLARESEYSRTTVYRGLDQLEAAGVVMEHGGEVTLTAFGALIVPQFIEWCGYAETVESMEEVLSLLPSGVVPGPDVIETFELEASQPTTECPLTVGVESARTDHVRVAVPVTPRSLAGESCPAWFEGDTRLDLVATPSAAGVIRQLVDGWSDRSDRPEVSVSVADQPFSYSLVVTDAPLVKLVAIGECGGIGSRLVSRQPSAHQWAIDHWETLCSVTPGAGETQSPVPSE